MHLSARLAKYEHSVVNLKANIAGVPELEGQSTYIREFIFGYLALLL